MIPAPCLSPLWCSFCALCACTRASCTHALTSQLMFLHGCTLPICMISNCVLCVSQWYLSLPDSRINYSCVLIVTFLFSMLIYSYAISMHVHCLFFVTYICSARCILPRCMVPVLWLPWSVVPVRYLPRCSAHCAMCFLYVVYFACLFLQVVCSVCCVHNYALCVSRALVPVCSCVPHLPCFELLWVSIFMVFVYLLYGIYFWVLYVSVCSVYFCMMCVLFISVCCVCMYSAPHLCIFCAVSVQCLCISCTVSVCCLCRVRVIFCAVSMHSLCWLSYWLSGMLF